MVDENNVAERGVSRTSEAQLQLVVQASIGLQLLE